MSLSGFTCSCHGPMFGEFALTHTVVFMHVCQIMFRHSISGKPADCFLGCSCFYLRHW
jgi:hypothetical protein